MATYIVTPSVGIVAGGLILDAIRNEVVGVVGLRLTWRDDRPGYDLGVEVDLDWTDRRTAEATAAGLARSMYNVSAPTMRRLLREYAPEIDAAREAVRSGSSPDADALGAPSGSEVPADLRGKKRGPPSEAPEYITRG